MSISEEQKQIAKTIRKMDSLAKEIVRRCGYCHDFGKHGASENLQRELGFIKDVMNQLDGHREELLDDAELRDGARRALRTLDLGGFRQKGNP